MSTPDDTVSGQHRADFRDVPGESDQQQWRKMWILTTTQMSSGLLQMLSSQSLAPISPGLPSIPGKPVLWYLLLSPVITCVFTSMIDCGFYRAETKLYSSLKVSRGLTSCLMNEYWKEKCLLQHRSDQQLWCSGSCDLCLRSVEKRVCGDSREEVVSGDHPLEGSLSAGTEQGTGERTIPAHQAFTTSKGGKQIRQQTNIMCQEGPCQEDP